MRFPTISPAQLAFFSAALLAFLAWRHRLAPKTHYQVLGVKSDSTAEDIVHAHKKLSILKTSNGREDGVVFTDDLQVQHAYAVLSDPLRRRDYDNFHQDELKDEVKRIKRQVDTSLELQQLPLWEPFNYEPSNLDVDSLTTDNFEVLLEGKEAWLIQIFSVASRNCWKHEMEWGRIRELMEGVAKVGRVELGDTKLATYFADRNKATGGHFFQHGLPAYVAFSPDCRSQGCMARYASELRVDGVVDWMATRVLRLPRIMYYSPQTLVSDLFQKSGPHKVKVVIFSTTGERAAPFIRKAAKDFWDYAAFGLVLWREENATLWESMFGVQKAPAVFILKDPGVTPVIFYGTLNSSMFENLLRENKNHVLPQLRSITARELGCTETGYSLAGQSEHTWYCVIVAGRPGFELSQARAVLRDVKDNLTKEASMEDKGNTCGDCLTATLALQSKRMALVWLDGYAQKQVCYFYLNSETVYETCGAKSFPDQSDVPQIFIVRYRRHPKDREKISAKKTQVNTMWQKLLEEDEDLASQIVAKYNGSLEAGELISWMSKMIKEGDTEDLLFYMKKAPPLVPEDSTPVWLNKARTYVSLQKEGLFTRCKSHVFGLLDYLQDPRFTPTVVLVLVFFLVSLVFTSKQVHNQGN
eukprot:c21878_g1_i1 orf=59-1981(-)